MPNKTISQTNKVIIYISTIIVGFILFALPNLFFGITKFNGGLKGINLLFIALFQFVSVTLAIYISLKLLRKDFRHIGLSSTNWLGDLGLGLLVGLLWAILQIWVIIPNTGGAERIDIAQELENLDGSIVGLLSLISLGIIGGGIAEEIFFRGYFINVQKGLFKNERLGLWIASILSIAFFAVGHLPSNAILWMNILISSTAYTLLFISTGRLTASIVAHSTWNLAASLYLNTLN